MTITLKIRRGGRRAQLALDLRVLQKTVAVQSRVLGELTYAAHCGEPCGDRIRDVLKSLESLHAQIEQREKQLAVLKGGVVCPACGAVSQGRCVYCGSCGHALAAGPYGG